MRKGFLTLTPEGDNRMPHDTFRWRGLDGFEIMTHFITTTDPWNTGDSWFYTYNGMLTAGTTLRS